jgi:hypothetical protein
VTGSTGDYWLRSINSGASAAGLSLAPGAGGQINVSFTPSASTPVGTVVSGTLYVDDYFDDLQSCDQLAAVPYTYTVGTAPPATTTPPPAPEPPPVTSPPASPRLARAVATGVRSTARKLTTHSASLRLPLRATWASKASSPCRVTVTATVPGALAKSRARTVTIGSGSLTVAAGRSAIVHLRLTTRGIQLLRSRHTLRITLHVAIRTRREFGVRPRRQATSDVCQDEAARPSIAAARRLRTRRASAAYQRLAHDEAAEPTIEFATKGVRCSKARQDDLTAYAVNRRASTSCQGSVCTTTSAMEGISCRSSSSRSLASWWASVSDESAPTERVMNRTSPSLVGSRRSCRAGVCA